MPDRQWPRLGFDGSDVLFRRARWGMDRDIDAARKTLDRLDGQAWLRYDYSTADMPRPTGLLAMVEQHPGVTIEHLSLQPARALEPHRCGIYRRLTQGRSTGVGTAHRR